MFTLSFFGAVQMIKKYVSWSTHGVQSGRLLWLGEFVLNLPSLNLDALMILPTINSGGHSGGQKQIRISSSSTGLSE